MTDKKLNDELLDDETEIEEASGHDEMNAEKKSVDSVDKAAKTGPKGKKRHADKTGGDKTADKPNKGIVRELYDRMNEMSQEELRKLHSILMDENFDIDEVESDEDMLEDIEYDFNEDLEEIVSDEATLSEEFRGKAAVIMETAIKSKLRGEIRRLEESYDEQLAEATESMQEELVEKIDSYLDYVVENWMEDNKLAVQNGLRTEIAENFMTSLKDLFTESYITVPEEKVDLVDDLAEQVESLESELNSKMEDHMSMKEELEMYKREAIIFEMAADLADTQLDKLSALAEDIDFDNEEAFREKVATIKEAYFGKKKASSTNTSHITEEADDIDDEVEVSGNMAKYVSALKKSASK